jgi:predicted secreted protein
MKRHKKIVVLCHCILNVNSKVEGLATYGGAMKSLVAGYIDKGYGIIQLPCPETTFCGLQRWGMSKNQYDHPNYRRHCRALLDPVVDQIQVYQENGYSIEEIVCIDGSPSCGLDLVSVGYKGGLVNTDATNPDVVGGVREKGVFIDELDKMLAGRGLHVKFRAVDEKTAPE